MRLRCGGCFALLSMTFTNAFYTEPIFEMASNLKCLFVSHSFVHGAFIIILKSPQQPAFFRLVRKGFKPCRTLFEVDKNGVKILCEADL